MRVRRDFATNARSVAIAAAAAILGLLSTLAAYVLLQLIHLFTNLFFYGTWSVAATSPAGNRLGALVIAIPIAGALVIGLMARYGSEKIRGHGIPEAIEAILFGKSRMGLKVALLKPLASGIAIGSGGPFGAEGPIIMTGGAIGSLFGQRLRISGAERKTLLVAGAVAGMTAVFGTPIAAVLLAVELLLFELRPRSLLPVAVACVTAAFARPVLFEAGPMFPLSTGPVTAICLLSCVLAGVASGGLSWLLSATLYRVEDAFDHLPVHWMWWPAIGALAIGVGGYIEPRSLGVGYDVIADLLHNEMAVGAVAALILCKATMWVIALSSGTSGGVLAPLLTIGAGLGVVMGPYLPGADPQLWPLVFMSAALGGMMRSPFMALMFGFEVSHDANALLPLLAACTTAYGVTVLLMPRSILTEKIARRGHHIYREYGIDPLERHQVDEVMTKEPIAIRSDLSLIAVRDRYFGNDQRHRAFPVVEGGAFIGMIDRACLEHHQHTPQRPIGDLFGEKKPVLAFPDETCRVVATRLAVHDLERLPVVTDAHSRRVVGIVTRSDLIKPLQGLHDEEHELEQMQPWPWQRARHQIP